MTTSGGVFLLAVAVLGCVGLSGCNQQASGVSSSSGNLSATSDVPAIADNSSAAGDENDGRSTPGKTAAEKNSALTPTAGTTDPKASGSAAPPRKPRVTARPAPGRSVDITFDTLAFQMERGGKFERSMLTPEVEDLDGSLIRIRGYIHPQSTFVQTGITWFILVRDNMQCCFGPGAMLYDCMIVQMNPGKTAEYSIRPVTVEGRFSIQEVLDADGKHSAIYRIDAQRVR